MGLQLKKIIFICFVLIIFISCTKSKQIKGDWGAIDPYGNYSEMYFSDFNIEVYDEIAGTIQFQTYRVQNDSLITSILKYNMNWINTDSLILISDSFSFQMKRINDGFKLSDKIDANDSDTFIENFYKRMNTMKRRDLNSHDVPNHNQKIEEEIIEIQKQ